MSVIEATGRISEIRSTIVALSPRTTTDAASSATFAGALNAVADTSKTNAASPPAAGGATGAATGSDVVEAAKKYLGVPYVFGGEDSTGMDCSGLVQRVFADLGIDLPRVVPDQAKVGTEVGSLAEAQPGDLIVAKGSGHILIYAGDNKVIHAPRPGTTVTLVENWRTDADIETIRRIVPTATPAATGGLNAYLLAAQRSALGGGSW